MSKFKEQRVGVLVDIQNLYYSAKVLHSKKVNFKNVLEEAVSGRKLGTFSTGLLQEEKSKIDVTNYFGSSNEMLLFEIIGKSQRQTLKGI